MRLRNIGHSFAVCTAHEDAGEATPAWFQTTPPYGDYPGGNITGKDGKPVENAVVRFDAPSVRKCVEAFRAEMARTDWPGILVDREHFSLDTDHESDAMAWATDIRVADDGSIWTKWRFTPEGERLWRDKVLVCRSPVLALDDGPDGIYRPKALKSIGMTNSPHFDLSPLAAARKAAAEETNTQGDHMDKEILAALGLAETASKADVLAAIKAMKDKEAAAVAQATDAEKKAETAEAACRGFKADAFIAAHKERISDVAKFREAYLKAPEATEAAFGLFRAQPAAPSTVRIVAREAATPAKTPGTGDASAKIAARSKAVNDYLAAHRNATHAEAWSACRLADPETFAD